MPILSSVARSLENNLRSAKELKEFFGDSFTDFHTTGGETFWQSLRDFVVDSMLAENTISPSDRELITYVSSPGEIVNVIGAAEKK